MKTVKIKFTEKDLIKILNEVIPNEILKNMKGDEFNKVLDKVKKEFKNKA